MTLLDKFSHLFRPDQAFTETEVVEEIRDRDARRAEVADVRAMIETEAYKRYRERVSVEIDALVPDHKLGMDAAAACAFEQKGLRSALRILDTIVAVAVEKLDGT